MKSDKKFLFAGLAVVIIVVGGIFAYQYYSKPPPMTHYNFAGTDLEFRNDLKAAKNVSLSPNFDTVFNSIWDANLQNVTIVYKNTSDNQLSEVNAFEITYKLGFVYTYVGWPIAFHGREVNEFQNLNATPLNLVVALVPPSIANETSVVYKDHVVYIQGTDQKNFDLATIKFIMTAYNITV